MEPFRIESSERLLHEFPPSTDLARSRAVSTNSVCSNTEEYSSCSDTDSKPYVAYRSCLHRVLENHKKLNKPVESLPEEKAVKEPKLEERAGDEPPSHVEFRNCKHCKSLFPFVLNTTEEWKVHFCSGECHLSYFVR